MLPRKYLLTSIAHALPWLLFSLLCGIRKPAASAELDNRDRAVLRSSSTPHELGKISPRRIAKRQDSGHRRIAWVQRIRLHSLPVVYPGTQALKPKHSMHTAPNRHSTTQDGQRSRQQARRSDVVHFANDVSSRSRIRSRSDFQNAQFMHAISARAPGFASGSSWPSAPALVPWIARWTGFREGGAARASRSPFSEATTSGSKTSKGQIVLRIMPGGGQLSKQIEVGPDTDPNE